MMVLGEPLWSCFQAEQFGAVVDCVPRGCAYSVGGSFGAIDQRRSFIRKCVEKTQKLRLGYGNDPNTEIGPGPVLCPPEMCRRMSRLLGDGVQRGAAGLRRAATAELEA